LSRLIGIFDSGLGGLTVARAVINRLPCDRIMYFADTAHVPYGERPLDEVKGFALGITRFLVERGASAVVMACNMSSAIALQPARDIFPDIPIIGVIGPGSRAAAERVFDGPIGVLATSGTVRSGAYSRAIHTFEPNAEVIEQACPAFVPLVEAGLVDTEEAEAAVRDAVEPVLARGAKTLVLGCTHYPFLREVIERVAPSAVIIDPAEETAGDLVKLLEDVPDCGIEAEHRFFASGAVEGLIRIGGEFLGMPIYDVETVEWGRDLHQPYSEINTGKV